MGKFEDKVEFYKDEMKKLSIAYKNEDFEKCAKACGPSLYANDAETVASSDKEELNRVKKNFIEGKLGITDEKVQDECIAHALDKFGTATKSKYRAIFYYLCATKAGKMPE